jgi:anthranilate phosphoribosyltransferase
VYETLKVNYSIVNSLDGYDEISLTSETRIATNHKEYVLSPLDFGMKNIQPEKLYGGNTVEEAAKIFVHILEGKGTQEQNNVVIANAALGLHLFYAEKTLIDCVEIAAESLKGRKALEKLRAVTLI